MRSCGRYDQSKAIVQLMGDLVGISQYFRFEKLVLSRRVGYIHRRVEILPVFPLE